MGIQVDQVCGGLCIELSGDLVGSWVREEILPFLGGRGRQGLVPDAAPTPDPEFSLLSQWPRGAGVAL